MKRLLLATAAIAIVGGSPASAAVLLFGGVLRGNNEVPPAASPGTGFALVTLDTVANTMRVQVNFSGLIGNTTASHIHCCAPFGVNATVATTVPTFAGFPLGVTAGSYDNTLDMTLASSFNPAFVTAHGGTIASARTDLFNGIIGGQAYLNVHTTQFPGGELRAQLLPQVPEPASWALMIAGFGLAGGALRVRTRRAALG